MRKDIKIVTRLCKEAGIFPGKHYTNIVNYIEKNNSYVFYGRDHYSYSTMGVDCEIKFLKLQFDILKLLIDNDLLGENDYILVLTNTLTRYDISKSFNLPWLENWKKIVKNSNKKEFVDFFFDAFEKNVGALTEREKNEIMKGMMPRN
jgi:hypothetical protein